MAKDRTTPPEARLRRGRQRKGEVPLNWPALGTLLAFFLVAIAWTVRQTPADAHFEFLKQQGAFFHFGEPGTRLSSLLRWLLRRGSGDAPYAVASSRVINGSALAFVPGKLTFSLSNAPAAIRKEIQSLGKQPSGVVLQDNPELTVALAALVLRQSKIHDSYSSALRAHVSWFKSLPEEWLFSWKLSADQKAALNGTMAEPILKHHEQILDGLKNLRLTKALGNRSLTDSEAAWVLGLVLYHVQAEEGVLVPGLLDNLQRHWNLQRCAVLDPKTSPTGRVPGWALVASKDVAADEEVYVCSPQANGRLLAMYGIACPGNPNGAVFSHGDPADPMWDSVTSEARAYGCSSLHVRSLFLIRDVHGAISDDNVRCSSLVWMDRHAIKAGYFDAWPREPEKYAHWIKQEAEFYVRIGAGCNRSKQGILLGVENATIDRLQADVGNEFSRKVLSVRGEELELLDLCLKWSFERASALGAVIVDKPASETSQAEDGDYDEL